MNRTRPVTRTVVAAALSTLAAGAVVAGSAGTSAAHPAPGAARPSSTSAGDGPGYSELAAVRRATAKYHDVAVAEAAGYIRVSGCEEHAGVGAMGYHYLNPTLALDAVIDPLRPEVLLYAPRPDGSLKLAGVEYFVAEQAVTERPWVLGRPFDGPMDGHSAGMPRHYDLHVWVWAHNPDGVASAWNPALSCAGAE